MNLLVNKTFWCASIAILAVCLCGCSNGQSISTLLSSDETYEKRSESSLYVVKDSDQMYVDLVDGIITMYLTVGMGSEEDGTNHTWKEVNEHSLAYYEGLGTDPYMCEALLQVGDELGPLSDQFGYGELNPNATVRLRGTGASEQPQKSYRIDIKKGKGSWEEQKVVVLNKHVPDPTRFRNKLAYDLMAEIPEMFSARTWFVHLYVKDRTEGADDKFEDYGLYTAVEQINKRYFKNRNLDSGGNIYKAGTFDWYPHSETLKLATDADFDQKAFEELLEIKGDVDHTKLLAMLQAVNDEKQPIREIIRMYFNRDNLFYWMGFHVLMGNRDVESSNFYLYSPQGVNTWYILSWDNDGMLSEAYERLRDEDYDPSWSHGIFPLVSARLFERILKDGECRAILNEVVDDIYNSWLSEDEIRERVRNYAEMIKPYVYDIPDSMFQRVSSSNYDRLVDAVPEEITSNYEAYKASMTEPWPFHIREPEIREGTMILKWDPSYVYPDGDLSYSVELSRDPNFRQDLLDVKVQTETSYQIELLPAGQYFLRVRATAGNGSAQDAYEYYLTETDRVITSTLCFYVLDDGSVQVNRYTEE